MISLSIRSTLARIRPFGPLFFQSELLKIHQVLLKAHFKSYIALKVLPKDITLSR